MKSAKRSSTIWGVVKPFFWISKVLGLAAFSIDGDIKNGRIKTGFWDIIYLAFVMTIQFGAFYLNVMRNMSLSRTNSLLIDHGARFIGVFNSFNVILATFLYAFHRKKAWKVFPMLDEIDRELLKVGRDVNKNVKKFFIATWAFVIALYFLLITMAFFLLREKVFKDSSHISFAFGNIVSNTYTATFMIYFCFILQVILRRFDAINDCIRTYFKTEEEEPFKVFEKKSLGPERLIIKLADLHDSLNDIVVIINQCFSFLIMMCFASAFLFNIFNIFAIYKIFVRQNYTFVSEAIVQSMWNAYFYLYCFMAIVVSSMVTRSGKFSAVLCHKAINYSDDESIIDHFKLFSQQMRHRSPVVSCGLFTFDFTLLFTILGATATYIVILIQFDSSPIEGPQLIANITSSN